MKRNGKGKRMNDMPNHTPDFKGFYDWKCTNCGQMFHQEFDCDTTQCPTCINKWFNKRPEVMKAKEKQVGKKSYTSWAEETSQLDKNGCYIFKPSNHFILGPDPFYYNGQALPDQVTIIE